VRIDEKDGVVEVVVDTAWRKAAPRSAYESMFGVRTASPKTASALRESIASNKTFGALTQALHG
jgi:hypothetical protein